MWKGLFRSSASSHKSTFEDIQRAIQNPEQFILINTLPENEQDCLIKNTLFFQTEENQINDLLNKYDFNSRTFIVYGKNTNDSTVETKYNQLVQLGFANVFMYVGGLFEWMLLQDIYGFDEFPTTKKVLDILKFKPKK